MSKVRVSAYAVSADGFGAGPDQSLENPLGKRGPELMQWFFPTRTFRSQILGLNDGTEGRDNDYAVAAMEGIGAWIMGRNMFAHSRGPRVDDGWQGWWGDVPPYHCDVFVLTHFPRDPLTLADTTFHFVTGGVDGALGRARLAAGGKDIRIGGGAATVRQYLAKGQIDQLHIVQSPVLLGKGEPLFAGLDLAALGYKVTKSEATPAATHLTIERQS